MLSRLAINTAPKTFFTVLRASSTQVAATTPSSTEPAEVTLEPGQWEPIDPRKFDRRPHELTEGPDRDLVNFPRPKRELFPGKVRLAIFPDEWFQFFYKKTGVTGPYVFGSGLLTYLWSKEIWPMEHEFFHGVGLVIFLFGLTKFVGPMIKNYGYELQKEQENHLEGNKNAVLNALKESITHEEKEQGRTKAQTMLIQAKKENVDLQLEAEYRRRQMMVYETVKKRLDYHMQVEGAKRTLSHRHMVNWVVDNVMKSITPTQEKEALQKCIADLKMLATK